MKRIKTAAPEAADATPVSTPMKPTCATCRYFLPGNNVCRRYPPTILVTPLSPQLSWCSEFPPMKPAGWCGEYQERERGK